MALNIVNSKYNGYVIKLNIPGDIITQPEEFNPYEQTSTDRRRLNPAVITGLFIAGFSLCIGANKMMDQVEIEAALAMYRNTRLSEVRTALLSQGWEDPEVSGSITHWDVGIGVCRFEGVVNRDGEIIKFEATLDSEWIDPNVKLTPPIELEDVKGVLHVHCDPDDGKGWIEVGKGRNTKIKYID